jgi:hypothetical protein
MEPDQLPNQSVARRLACGGSEMILAADKPSCCLGKLEWGSGHVSDLCLRFRYSDLEGAACRALKNCDQ